MIAVSMRRALDAKGADAVMAAAEKEAIRKSYRVVIAVVDAWGHVLQLRRTEGAQAASGQVAHGRPSALHLARAVPLQGGMPIVHAGHVAGAVGVSGASSADEDQELSVLAAEAASAAVRDGGGKAAIYFPAESVAAKFATGGLLHDTPSYKIDAGRRTAAGEVEYHEHVADIMHVVSGTATVVTGGQMIASRTVGPGEMRAAVMEGGTRHELGAGDVLVIPPGVPHHFAAVSDPFLYLVAKVQD